MSARVPENGRRRGPAVEELVRPTVLDLPHYTLDQVPCRFKLDQNEVPWDVPGRIKRRVVERLLARDWSRYPDFHADDLRRRLAEHNGWTWEGVLAGNGSNELLGVALEATSRPGGEVLGHVPCFGLYRMMILRGGATPRFLGPRDDVGLPIDELTAEVERDPRRPLLLCTPNNPVGDAVSPAAVEALLERLEAPLLLDNAYGEFCRHDYRPLLATHRHLLIFRTFSKAWSLGGMRLGYLLGDPELVRQLMKFKAPYNLGHASTLTAEAVLEEPATMERHVGLILGRRAHWRRMLEGAGLEVFPSEASFLLVRCGAPEEAERIRSGLAERGILVRDVGRYPGLAGCLRFSVGSGPALRATAAAFEELGLGSARELLERPAGEEQP